MNYRFLSRSLVTIAATALFASPLFAQNTIQLFGPINVRQSQTNATYSNPVTFSTTTLTLSCPASPVAVLSSAPLASTTPPFPATANLLVDNNINVSNITNGTGPTNVCTGGVDSNPFENCFSSYYQANASNALFGTDPDTFVATGGVPPIDISNQLSGSATQQIEIDLQDEGGEVASSTLTLNTNCTPGGVTGPATITGNTIPASNPSNSQLNQSFTFNPTTNNQVTFNYNLGSAASTLTTNSAGANPVVTDNGLTPSAFATYASGTPFATSSCLIHNGEILDSTPVCKLYTLECTNGTGSDAAGANCPVSSVSDEQLQDVFDGPSFSLPNIPTTNGPTFHEGMGFLMASEGWTGGECTFDPNSGLQNDLCPLNLLTSFTGPGTFTGTGQTTHPNSTFISVSGVPEDLTTVSLTDSTGATQPIGPGNWTNNSSPYVALSSQPPNLANANPPVPNAANFVAAPIANITYGISPGTTAPAVGTTSGTDTVFPNPSGCPTTLGSTPATTLATGPVQFSGLADGNYVIHYYATDCAGTEELLFTQDPNTQNWSTNYYTYALNIDTVPPSVTVPVLSPTGGAYTQGQTVTATFTCTDDRSGVASCGGQTFPANTLTTGLLTVPMPTNVTGPQTFTVTAVDAAGNHFSQSVPYTVTPAYDAQVQLTLSSGTVTYPGGTNLVVKVSSTNGHAPVGSVKIMDGSKVVTTLGLGGSAAYYYISGLSAGTHFLQADYLGDTYNPAGNSAPVTLIVNPVPVNLTASCWNTPYPYGANFNCGAYASSNAGAPLGSITYTFDSNPAVTLPLSGGSATFIIPKPVVGNHSITIAYPAQTNYAAAKSVVQNFVVTAAPVQIALTPSSWYLTGGNLTLTASVQSWSAGPPNATGSVTFAYGNHTIATVPVNASGVATTTIAAHLLPEGSVNITATYNGSANYSPGSSSVSIQLAY